MPNDVVRWPTVGAGQQLYIIRPAAQDWRSALRDYYDVEDGDRPTDAWNVEWTYRRNDLLITYFQTNPMMIVHLDRFVANANQHRGIEWKQYCHFRNGVPLSLVEQRAGVRLAGTAYLEEAEAQLVVAALKSLYKSGVSVFGDRRIADLQS